MEVISIEDRRKDLELNHYWKNGFSFFNNPVCVVETLEDRVVLSNHWIMRTLVRATEGERLEIEAAYNQLIKLASAQLVAKFFRYHGDTRITLLKPL